MSNVKNEKMTTKQVGSLITIDLLRGLSGGAFFLPYGIKLHNSKHPNIDATQKYYGQVSE